MNRRIYAENQAKTQEKSGCLPSDTRPFAMFHSHYSRKSDGGDGGTASASVTSGSHPYPPKSVS